MSEQAAYHIPVMVEQVLESLDAGSGGRFLDGTLGGGGHARALLEAAPEDVQLFGLDRDCDAVKRAGKNLAGFADRVTLKQGNFRDAGDLYKGLSLDGVLLDLGVSSHQLDTPERGFSCDRDGPLDMRMDADDGITAARLLNGSDEDELAEIFRRWGESRYSRRIARRILESRRDKPLESTAELARIVRTAVPRQVERKNVVQVFQALRIAVNDELGALRSGLEQLFDMLAVNGRLVVISYHSLEDRIVKRFFAELTAGCVCPPELPFCACGKLPRAVKVTRRPVRPASTEVERNSRSRSALLRAVRRLDNGESAGERFEN
ncbi:MAG: 16S rRNA (cytosine(1402)-N(4))-methyltransferase RsmH [Candidatus Glassbacteria bacterium]|nr:16S rRNA (cytosine(1402)-N(4))-methyltransferase RsmH [Candidatus Glassbacteria bacterium]